MKKSATRVTVIFILLITLVVGYFAYLSNRRQVSRREETAVSAAENALSRDMLLDYPATPKEVLKYYNDIIRCFYNEDCTDEEIESLGGRARELYDKELLDNNDYDMYMFRLKSDIQEYKEKKRRITNIALPASTNVNRYTVDGYDFARLACGYTISEGGSSKYANMVYLMRRDENKKWKIYGWDFAENVELAEKKEE